MVKSLDPLLYNPVSAPVIHQHLFIFHFPKICLSGILLFHLLSGGFLMLLVIQGHLLALSSMAMLWGLHFSFAEY